MFQLCIWKHHQKEWGWCSIDLGSALKVETNAGEIWGSLNCEVKGIQTDEEFFCANFRSKVDETLERIELTVY
jgi:hypothetical protein